MREDVQLACISSNEGNCLVLHQKLLLGVQIVKLWNAQDMGTVLQSSSHNPIVIYQHINVSPLIQELHSILYALFRQVLDTISGHKL